VGNLRFRDDSPLASEKFGCVEHVDGVDVRWLATNAEPADQSAVALDISTLHIVEQAATLADEHHESTARVMIALVNL